MFLVDCPRCRQRMLCSVHRVRAVWSLAPGMIAVALTCYRGHPVTMLTGRAFRPATAGAAGGPDP